MTEIFKKAMLKTMTEKELNELYDSLYFKKVFWLNRELQKQIHIGQEGVFLDNLNILHIATQLKVDDAAAVITAAQEKIKGKADPTPEERQLLNTEIVDAAALAVSLMTPEEIAEILKSQYEAFY